jgi:hypothetical protein
MHDCVGHPAVGAIDHRRHLRGLGLPELATDAPLARSLHHLAFADPARRKRRTAAVPPIPGCTDRLLSIHPGHRLPFTPPPSEEAQESRGTQSTNRRPPILAEGQRLKGSRGGAGERRGRGRWRRSPRRDAPGGQLIPIACIAACPPGTTSPGTRPGATSSPNASAASRPPSASGSDRIPRKVIRRPEWEPRPRIRRDGGST